MALRRLNPSNINYKDRDIGGSVRGGPVAASPAPTGGIFAPDTLAPEDLVPLELEDAPEGYTIEDIVQAAAAVAETPEEAEKIVEEYIGEDGDRDTMQQLQDSAAALWRKNNYGSEDAIAPAVGAPKSTPGSYFQDIPSDVERVAPVEGFMGQNSLAGSDMKAPLKFIPKVATNKLPGEQHPGVDYSSVDRPLPEKNLGRLATESAKEAETYRGIFGGGSASGFGGSVAYPSPISDGPNVSGSSGSSLTAKALGVSDTAFGSYKEAIADIESNGKYDIMGGSASAVAGGRFGGKYQMGGEEIKAAARTLGIDAPVKYVDDQRGNGKKVAVADDTFLKNPDLQEKLFDAFTLNQHKSLEGRNDKYGGLTPAEKLQTLGYAHNQGAGGASQWLRTGVAGKDAFGTSGNKYVEAVGRVLNGPIGGTPQGSPTEMLTRPGDYGFEQNRGVTDIAALEGLVGSSLPGSVAEAHQQNNDAIAQMRDRDPRTGFDSMATPGVNPSAPANNMYQGVARPQDFAPEDPYAPRSVTTTPVAPLPAAPHYEQMLDQNILNNNSGGLPGSYYDPSQYAQTTPSGSFNLEREAETISGSSGSDLNGGSEGDLDQYQQFMEPSVAMPTYPTGPAAGRGTPQYSDGVYELQNDRRLTGDLYGYPEVSTPTPSAPVVSTPQPPTSGYLQDIPSDVARVVDAPPSIKDQYAAYGAGKVAPTPTPTAPHAAVPQSIQQIKAIDAVAPVVVDPKDAVKKEAQEVVRQQQRQQPQQSRTPRYSSKTQAMINAGMAQPAPSGVRQPVDFLGKGAQTGFKTGLGAAGIPGAITGGILGAVLPSLTSGYNGIFTGGNAPALSNATQLGGAYDVYNDRSGRNTWAVSGNSGNIVSRDANTGWTGVTSNVNGKGPVTTITLRDGSTAASGFPSFGGSGIFGSSDDTDRSSMGSGGTGSYGAYGTVDSGMSGSGGGDSGGQGSGGGGFFDEISSWI